MLTPEGHVKVMDFGLAKQLPTAETVESQEESISTSLTTSGATLGTLAYMSPEQVRGQRVDTRSDIFSFGVVLYEMFTGVHPFKKDFPVDTGNAILSENPAPLSQYGEGFPSLLQRTVRKMLAKEAHRRYQHIGDVRIDMEELMSEVTDPSIQTEEARVDAFTAAASETSAPVAKKSWWQLLPWAVALVARPLPGTEGARYPFFSRDSQWVGFFAEGELRKVSVSGDAPLRISDVPAVNRGASWGPDGTIIFSAAGQGLMRVPAAGGAAEALTTIDTDKGEQSHIWPRFLPDGRAVLFGIYPYQAGGMAVLSLETGERHVLGHKPRGPARYLQTGHLVWGEGGGIRAAPFDRARLELAGPHVLLLHGVYEPPNDGGLFFAVSPTGALVYVPGGVDHALVVVDRSGNATPLTDERRGYRFPRFSPDGRRVAVTIDPPDQGDSSIWVYNVERGAGLPLTFQGHQLTPVWSLDGRRLVYSSLRPDLDLYWRAADGTGEAHRLLEREYIQHPESWSPNGFLAFTEHHPDQDDILVLSKDGVVSPFLVTRFDERMPRFSPDGKWLAYVSDESGQDEVYVQPYPGPGRKILISIGGGRTPEWAADGRELVYRSAHQMMVVALEIGSTFDPGKPRPLFEDPYDKTQHGNYDISPDGQRFVMIKRSNTQFNLVFNWFEDLKRAGAD